MEKRECKYCNQVFQNMKGKVFANHVKWCAKNPTSPRKVKCEFCSKDVNSLLLWKHTESCMLNPKNLRMCPVCEKPVMDPDNEYCGSSCFAKQHNATRTTGIRETGYKFTKITKNCEVCSIAMVLPTNTDKTVCDNCMLPGQIRKFKCEFCEKEFERPYWLERRTCSDGCYTNLLSKNARENPNCGGETNWYKYKYKGITMDSSWEVATAVYLDSKNVKWVRKHSMWFPWQDSTGKQRRYHPDFYLPDHNLYLDPKFAKKLEEDMPKLVDVVKTHKIDLLVGEIKKLLVFLDKTLTSREICKGLVIADIVVDDAKS